ncbi:hypothetical protein [Pseudomonas aeruginosa]|uniref:hypothetical protein n=1 Tax=Pseudomonas aeruginosa TaxID=287 RepID=UPI000F532CBA|nr:hypothetical protein [Pseudomonas aeruginosa]EIU1413953.1 hypothetical protein [Pseudomonas aeruginosa]MCG9956495.1 hypothetical protein [Pseudomonas aeruginosa]RTB51794.1 hypothetical protein EJ654_28115 [Pseudomonas aeruginosa]RTC34172.1 hypothetical protein EJ705_24845 [Pseudomonas aeruginosa]HEJ2986057.1 hypothetical protein [Pseudomonas aeruginosa]
MNTKFHDDEVGQESAAEVIEVTGLEDAITDIPETGEEQPPELQPTSALSQSFKLLNVYSIHRSTRGAELREADCKNR